MPALAATPALDRWLGNHTVCAAQVQACRCSARGIGQEKTGIRNPCRSVCWPAVLDNQSNRRSSTLPTYFIPFLRPTNLLGQTNSISPS